jgi:hypothetical protein
MAFLIHSPKEILIFAHIAKFCAERLLDIIQDTPAKQDVAGPASLPWHFEARRMLRPLIETAAF